MESDNNQLLRREEAPPQTGAIEQIENLGVLAALVGWFADILQSATTGEAYRTFNGAIRHGLIRLRIPFVEGWLSADENPADRASIAEGTHRLSVYHRDHTGEVVNPAFEHAYKNRLSGVALTTSLREKCGCGVEGCLIHNGNGWDRTGARATGVRRTGTGIRSGNCAGVPTGEFVEVGDVATNYANKVRSGLRQEFKTPVLGMLGGRVRIVETRTFSKRSGMGQKGADHPSTVTYRYATVCGCGKRTCWGLCVENSNAQFTIVNTRVGRTQVALDPRRQDFDEVVAALKEQVGEGALVMHPIPFQGVASATPAGGV